MTKLTQFLRLTIFPSIIHSQYTETDHVTTADGIEYFKGDPTGQNGYVTCRGGCESSNRYLSNNNLNSTQYYQKPPLRNLMYDAENKVAGCRVYGNIYSFAYYYVDLMIGKDTVQRTSVIMDTGSGVCAFPCKGCNNCGTSHLDTPFDHDKSPTIKAIFEFLFKPEMCAWKLC